MISRLRHQIPAKVSRIPRKIRYANFRPSSDHATVTGIDKHVASLSRLLDRGDVETFLDRLSELVGKLVLSDVLKGRALFMPELDELARKASLMFAPDRDRVTSSNLLVYVATTVYEIGGHTKVIEDIAAALPEYQHVLIITGMHQSHPTLVALRPRFDELNLRVHALQCMSRAERTRELSSLITALGPETIFLLAHHEDSIANAGVPGHAAKRVVFLHHADHQPCLGAGRRDYVHVDLTPVCHSICASDPLRGASLLNLTVTDVGTVRVTERRPIIGATCARSAKYLGSSSFSYGQLLAAMFSSGVDRVLHIGDMSGLQKDRICADVVANGQEAGRVVFLDTTPSLAAKLVELSPDFYLNSHPIGGGKASVEALSVGLPVLFVRPESTLPLLCPDMTFGTSVSVSALDQVPAAVRRLESEKRALARKSRAVYEDYYSPEAFRRGLLSVISGGTFRNTAAGAIPEPCEVS